MIIYMMILRFINATNERIGKIVSRTDYQLAILEPRNSQQLVKFQ